MTDDVVPAQLPADQWQQVDEPVHGIGTDGRGAKSAQAVVVVGIAATREAPPLAALSAYHAAIAQNAPIRIASSVPQRAGLVLCADAAVRVCASEIQAEALQGMPLPANVPTFIPGAGDVYVVATTAGPTNVGWYAVLHNG